ncbi:MAG: adenylate/guanylate cyclase domain-containing protein [Flavobacteriales bacterium]|nr:adenylate/guanylate cyclase domain-containing protein [Flavobacteriales bacterium]
MFTDIVGSTGAAEAMGDQAYSRLRHVHDELFKRTITRDGAGTIIKQIGDSFLCVFRTHCGRAARCGVPTGRAREQGEPYGRRVHAHGAHGIHLGQVAVEDALRPDVFGRHVNMAARIEALATGGQVLTSRSVWRECQWLGRRRRGSGHWIYRVWQGAAEGLR